MTPGRAESVPDAAVDELVRAADGGGVTGDYVSAGRTEDGFSLAAGQATAAGLTEAELRAAAADHGARVAEWYFWRRRAPEPADRRAFLAWVERVEDRDPVAHRRALADGLARSWGQLRVTAGLTADGHRRYGLRHVDDAATPTEDLATRDDPDAVHEIARFDGRGRYRPLKTAPTLQTGWAFVGLDAAALVRAVDEFYPATIANWYREREGALDVTHWRETAERQTGIYDVVDELTGEQVEWLAGACCVDAECCKRRQWDESAEEDLDVPRGEGEFPCREPCSFVVAAAREVALAERDESGPISLEASETELAQVERIVEAVAEGDVEDIRDGDLGDGANRLRARYVREKLFAGED